MNLADISKKLIDKGLKVTPQRIAIFEGIVNLNNHPTTDQILEYIRKKNPNISLATVYKVLDTFVEKKLIKTVKTDKDIKRYDAITQNHHHIYYADSEKIEDYVDEELSDLLKEYFEKKAIPDLIIEDIKLQIVATTRYKTRK
jgi:Fur family transcriptional regulator, peroxide stress response regulator